MEDKVAENTKSEQQNEKKYIKTKDSLRELWDNRKHINICIIGVPEKRERVQEPIGENNDGKLP